MSFFYSRKKAGLQLAKYLDEKFDADYVVVCDLSSVEIGEIVADSQNAELKMILSSYLRHPNSSTKIGAITHEGTLWVEDEATSRSKIDDSFLKNKVEDTSFQAERAVEGLKSVELSKIKNSKVIIVSDRITDGYREMAAAGALLKRGPEKIAIASPLKSKTPRNFEKVSNSTYFLKNPIFNLDTPTYKL